MSTFARFLLTFTAMIPAFLIAALVLWLEEKSFYISCILASTVIILIIFSIFIIKYMGKNGERISIKFKAAKPDNNSNMDYCLFYLSPLLNLKNNILNLWILSIIAIVFVIVKTASPDCSFNPILRIFGWRFYSIETDNNISYLIMTKKPIRDTQQPIEIVRMTEYVLLQVS